MKTLRLRNDSRPALHRGAGAFTLVELLTVIAIIGILAGILIPTIGGIQNQMAQVQTKNQFSGYAQAYLAFKAEYGFLPRMGVTEGDKFELKNNNEVFIQTLSGRKRNGDPMDNEDAKKANKRRANFYTFEQKDFALQGEEFQDELVDAYGNPNIVIVVDVDGNGVIPSESLPMSDKDINTQVAIYVAENRNFDWKQVTSWDAE